MRQIKFRAWDKKRNQMHYNAEAFDVFQPIFEDGEEYTFSELLNDPEMIIMQFTGLLDKHGKEIYESDILMKHIPEAGYTSGPLTVTWIHWQCGFSVHGGKKVEYEIIGNIHEGIKNQAPN